MRIIQQFILVFLSIFFLSSCQSVPKVDITFQGKETLSFTGRGSSAGFMLDSLLPGGIAIGLAIDEGIAKDIYKNLLAYKPDFSIQTLIQSHLKKNTDPDLVAIQIKNYGFRTSQKDSDHVSAWLELEFVCKSSRVDVNYPEDFSDIPIASFKSLKETENVSFKMLDEAIKIVIDQLNMRGQC